MRWTHQGTPTSAVKLSGESCLYHISKRSSKLRSSAFVTDVANSSDRMICQARTKQVLGKDSHVVSSL